MSRWGGVEGTSYQARLPDTIVRVIVSLSLKNYTCHMKLSTKDHLTSLHALLGFLASGMALKFQTR